MWTKGKDANAEQMRAAAGAILVQTKPTAAEGVSVLEAAGKSASSDGEDLNISLALLSGYRILEDYPKLLSLASDLAKRHPESERLFFDQLIALRGLGRSQEADALAQERLKRVPDDLESQRAFVWNALARDDYSLAHDLGVKIVESGKGDSTDLNNVAWNALFTGKTSENDAADALKAVQQSQNNASNLHTLACVYLELGRTKEARDALIQAMNILGLEEPDSNYWYAFGRLAEDYGLTDVAAADYSRVAKPESRIQFATSSYHLAQMRLQSIGTNAKPPANENNPRH